MVFYGKEASELFLKYMDLIKKESDRGAIIISASLLDVGLENLLKSKLINNDKKDDVLFNGANAPLSSFSSRIEFAYRMGLIRKDVKNSFNALRKIRNEFAHTIELVSLDDSRIKDKLLHIFSLSSDIFNAAKSNSIDISVEKKLGITEENYIEELGVRNVFNICFALNAMAINRVYLDVERIEELI